MLQAKQFDLHVTIGDALVNAVLGPLSTEARDKWNPSTGKVQLAVVL